MAGITINSNIASLQTQRRLGDSSSALNQSFQRLSSGQRINRASDDAAGLAISDSLRTDRLVYTQGIRNLNDGVSMLDIGDGALNELSNIVIRVQELAEQASNGTFSNRQRAALDTEAQALGKEYLRIAQTTEFNGQKLFDGSIQGLTLQGSYATEGGIQTTLGGVMGTGAVGTKTDFTAGAGANSVALGDLNGDGYLDIATANDGGGTASVLLGNGNGSLNAKIDYTAGNNPDSVTLGDLNGDGFLDILTANRGTSNASVLLGNGDGSFKAKIDTATVSARSITLGDLNSDGILDMVTADWFGSNTSVLLGNGNGTFKAATAYTTGASPWSLTLGDVNGDGILDLASANYSGVSASILLGNGNGTFKAKTDFTTGTNPHSVTFGDVNSDGILDLVSANRGTSNASVLIGNGNGTFKAKADFTTGTNPDSVNLGDLNGDGFLDIVTANYSTSNTSVLLGNGNGTFRAKTDYAAGGGAYSVNLGDLNSDGVLDIVTANSTASTTSVLLGRTRDGVAPLLPYTLKTQTDAKWALSLMDSTLDRIATHRGQLGSIQSRLTSAIGSNSITVENYAVAESQIRDADVAQEASLLTKNKILQQAGSSILAHANHEPEIALKLLKGV